MICDQNLKTVQSQIRYVGRNLSNQAHRINQKQGIFISTNWLKTTIARHLREKYSSHVSKF